MLKRTQHDRISSDPPAKRLRPAVRADGQRTRRAPITSTHKRSIDAGIARCLGDGASSGILAGRKETTRKLYRDAYEAFRRFLIDQRVDPSVDGWQRLPPNALAAFYRWGVDHRHGGLAERTAASYAYGISALLRQLLVEGLLPASLSLEKLRIGLRQSLSRGDYLRRKVDPRLDAFVAWVAARPIPSTSEDDGTAVSLRCAHVRWSSRCTARACGATK
jgi:hypothetical protein